MLIQAEDISNLAYGAETRAIRALLLRARRFEPFAPRRGVEDDAEAPTEHLRLHLAALRGYSGSSELLAPIRIVSGAASTLAQEFALLNLVTEASPYPQGLWYTLVMQASSVLQRRIREDSRLLDLVGPPLFPFAGDVRIMGGSLAADESKLDGLPSELRRSLWTFLCTVDDFFAGELMWLLAGRPSDLADPFEPLLAACERGFYPLGLRDGALEVYRAP